MPKKGVRATFHLIPTCWRLLFLQILTPYCYRLSQRPLPPLLRRVATPLESTRFGPIPPSEDPRLSLYPVHLSAPEKSCISSLPGTSTPSSSIPWALRAPSRLLKTTIHWCSSLTEELTSQWSRKLAKNSIASRSQESTPSLDPTASRRHTSWSPLSKMPWTSPTRSVLCESDWSPINRTRSQCEYFDVFRRYPLFFPKIFLLTQTLFSNIIYWLFAYTVSLLNI